MDALSTEWPIWWLLLGLGLPLLLVVLYVKERGPFFVRWPGRGVVSYLMPIVFAPLLWLYSLVAVYVSTPIFNRLGRVRVDRLGAPGARPAMSASATLTAEIAVAVSGAARGRAPSCSRPWRPRSCPRRARHRGRRSAWRLTSGSLESRSAPISTVRIPNIRQG